MVIHTNQLDQDLIKNAVLHPFNRQKRWQGVVEILQAKVEHARTLEEVAGVAGECTEFAKKSPVYASKVAEVIFKKAALLIKDSKGTDKIHIAEIAQCVSSFEELGKRHQENVYTINPLDYLRSLDLPNRPHGASEEGAQTTTNMARYEQVERACVDEIVRRFPDGVQIFSIGCSYGHEPYTIGLLIMDKIGSLRAQQYPIVGIERNEDAYKKAASGFLHVDSADICDVLKTGASREGILKYLFGYSKISDGSPHPVAEHLAYRAVTRERLFSAQTEHRLKQIFPKPIENIENLVEIPLKLQTMISFENKDGRKVMKDELPSDKPIVIYARTVWYHFAPGSKGEHIRGAEPLLNQYAKDLFDRMAPGSILIVGESDVLKAGQQPDGSGGTVDFLGAGFIEIDDPAFPHNVFIRR